MRRAVTCLNGELGPVSWEHMISAESIPKNAVVNATPFRAACENSRASIGRTRTIPCVSTKATRMTSNAAQRFLPLRRILASKGHEIGST